MSYFIVNREELSRSGETYEFEGYVRFVVPHRKTARPKIGLRAIACKGKKG